MNSWLVSWQFFPAFIKLKGCHIPVTSPLTTGAIASGDRQETALRIETIKLTENY